MVKKEQNCVHVIIECPPIFLEIVFQQKYSQKSNTESMTYKGFSDFKAHLDYCEDPARSCEKLTICFPAQTVCFPD